MICFKDTTFCSSSYRCANTECERRFAEKDLEDARTWWGNFDAPIAWSDFRMDCGKFVEAQN